MDKYFVITPLNRNCEGNSYLAKAVKSSNNKKTSDEAHSASLYARSLIEASLDPLLTISAEGKITDVNKATEQVTGCTREQLIGNDFSNYFTEPEKSRAIYAKIRSERFVKDYPLLLKNPSRKSPSRSKRWTYKRHNRGYHRFCNFFARYHWSQAIRKGPVESCEVSIRESVCCASRKQRGGSHLC